MQFAGETDNALMEYTSRGNKEAYEALFLRHWQNLFNIAYRKTGNNQDALDIVQELFIYIWEKRESIHITGNVAAYLTVSLRNRIVNWYRITSTRTKQKEALLERLQNMPESTQQQQAATDYTATLEQWQSAIDMLPDRMKEIYVLRHHHQLSIAEISSALSLRPQSIRNQLSEASDRVRSALEKHLWVAILISITV
ncbi:RNA polymerase sigma-70 factor (ECF subfamily) [Filimonas zeae]|uniref:DNA-directed RNA polymerase sigma-70 factor n=1 Tax=Filimonas zeae TaxID=1737353 RepID=A0A917MWF1_9BACT|nr:sigma-70 family RNA polymerase sigma factor [Filimonas zeae]MDR6339840.1 RNA polymerase sigma-70 factor (ECF subfamily) [Filimonas zeae]GGH69902.1 DNA-directed RNA polymerase sigma-70 factor [Filimonas zeae]